MGLSRSGRSAYLRERGPKGERDALKNVCARTFSSVGVAVELGPHRARARALTHLTKLPMTELIQPAPQHGTMRSRSMFELWRPIPVLSGQLLTLA